MTHAGKTPLITLKSVKGLLGVLIMTFVVGGTPAVAETTNSFTTCLLDSLSGRDRKNLAKWIFYGMAEHSEIRSLTAIPDSTREHSDQFVGELFNRILLESCPQEFKTAQAENPMALQVAFSAAGEVAMQELMTDTAVTDALSSYTNYVDFSGINSLLAN